MSKDKPSVKISDLLRPDRVVPALRVNNKAQLLRELSRCAGRMLPIEPQVILDAVEAREALGSTGVGDGIAVPHTRIKGLSDIFGLFARLERPIDFGAIDGRPVDLVFLLLVPERTTANDNLAALAAVARQLRDSQIAAQLRVAANTAQLYELLAASPSAVD